MASSFLFRVRNVTPGGHVEIAIFAGPDREHRALAGAFMLRLDEARSMYSGLGRVQKDIESVLESDALADGIIDPPAWEVDVEGIEKIFAAMLV